MDTGLQAVSQAGDHTGSGPFVPTRACHSALPGHPYDGAARRAELQ